MRCLQYVVCGLALCGEGKQSILVNKEVLQSKWMKQEMSDKVEQAEYIEEYKNIGGIEQYLLHYPAKSDAPVMLFLHGGPGSAESPLGYLFRKWWGDLFTVVHWDQRGSGKTLGRNPKYKPRCHTKRHTGDYWVFKSAL